MTLPPCSPPSEERNHAYASALERVIEEDDFVLDIGAGSGLLSMLAARHTKAQHVFACEGDAALARAARGVVEANGLAERVTVINRLSNQLELGYGGEELPTRADVIV